VVEEDRNHLQREKTTNAKRVALKEALGEADAQGHEVYGSNPTVEAAEKWVNEAANLIGAALQHRS
jgi:threonine aldolase